MEKLESYFQNLLSPHVKAELLHYFNQIKQHATARDILLVFVAVLIVSHAIRKIFGNLGKKLPPGPLGLPIVGYLPFLTRSPHRKLDELRKKYGNVFGFNMGSFYTVVLGDFDSIKEGMCKEECLARPETNVFDGVEGSSPNFLLIHGLPWKEQRRFALQTFRDLGFGKSRMEEHIKDEIFHLMNEISKYDGQPCDIHNLLTPSMSNNISCLVFGRRFEYDDPKRIMLDRNLEKIAKNLGQTAIQQFFPWILKVTKFLRVGSLKETYDALVEQKVFIRKEMDEHKRTLQENDIRDYIDAFLIEMKKHENNPNTYFTDAMLENNVGAFFGAGSETVRTTIDWALIIVASFPKVQEKIIKEIHAVFGENKTPSWADQSQMPYCNAVLMEVFRWKTTVPLNLARRALTDIKIQGYDIPKGTTLLANLWGCHHDPKYWKNPEIFDPQRFLTEDGKLKNVEQLIPFSIGKRSCPGETLAKNEVFLYFVSILQRFQVDLADDKDLVNSEMPGISLQPRPFKLIFRSRLNLA